MTKVKALIAVLISLSLSGCIALAAGGAAGGATGYYIAKEDRSDSQVAEDDGISGQVRQRFAQDPQLSVLKITVDTYLGTVTLSGDVPSGTAAERAIDTARGVSGVKGVRSELTVR